MADLRHIGIFNIRIFIVLLVLMATLTLWADSFSTDVAFKGQASGWTSIREDNTQLGLRYIPELSLWKGFSEAYSVSLEAAANAQMYRNFTTWNESEGDESLDSYRLWLRFAAPQYELRAGQQKVSFGSASLLRPLMWFDSIDPRDPLQLTTGVYGLLGRYFFLNNANIWIWGLFGNDDLKGWETIPSKEDKIEFGGRVQLPMALGEIALSFHQRQVDTYGSAFAVEYPYQDQFTERRIGLDGKWDIGIGLWCEGTITHLDSNLPIPQYLRQLTLGSDYTFSIGNGPHLLFEQHVSSTTEELFETGNSRFTSALLSDYPLNLLDAISLIVYYDWGVEQWSRYVTWQRTYDAWQVHLSAFLNSENQATSTNDFDTQGFSSKGVQIMLVINH